MQALALRVGARDAEPTLDRLLPLAPEGVYDRGLGALVEFLLTGSVDRDAAVAAVGGALLAVADRELPDDPEERMAQLLRPR